MYSREAMFIIPMLGYLFIGLLWILPLLKGLLIHEKRAWLSKLATDTEDEGTKKVYAETLNNFNEKNNQQPFYQLFKFQLGLTGLIVMILGLMTILSKLITDVEVIVLLPLVFGAVVFGLYKLLFSNSGVWREIGVGALFGGFAYTFSNAFQVYELDFMRADLILYIILIVGLLLYKMFSSNVVTYLYLTMIVMSPSMVRSYGDVNEWLIFLNLLPWLFLAAMFYMWIPRLEKVKEIGLIEISFGIMLVTSTLTLTTSLVGGLMPLAMGVVLPLLYIISKLYFSKGTWVISKPIQLIVTGIVIAMMVLFSQGDIMGIINSGYFLFTLWSIPKVFMLLIIGGLGFTAYLLYNKLDESKAEIDNLVLLFPPFFAVVAWFGDWGSSYLVLLYALALGYSYLSKGIENKDEFFVIIGTSVILGSVLLKLSQFLTGGWFESAFMNGIFIMILGAIILAAMLYLRTQWTVSKEDPKNVGSDGEFPNIGDPTKIGFKVGNVDVNIDL